MQRGQIPNGQGTRSSCVSSTEPNCPHRPDKFMPSQPCSHGELAGISPTLQQSFSSLAVQKSHFLSSNTKAPAASPRRLVWRDEPLPCSNTIPAPSPVHKHKKGCACSHPGLAQCLLLSLLHLIQCQMLMECGPPSKAQRLHHARARLEGGSGLFAWWNCKKIGTVLVVLA